MANDIRKYYVKENWIFNLEAMHDKLWCIIYDIQDGEIQLPVDIAGKTCKSVDDIQDLIDECSKLEWTAKSGKVTSREYGRIKQIVSWRVEQRYVTCMNAGMSERDAGGCFNDL